MTDLNEEERALLRAEVARKKARMTDLNEDERALLRAEASRKKAAVKWDAKIQELRTQIIKHCRHAQTTEFTGEHDTGYGVQTKHVGLRCVFCLKVNRWPRVNYDKWEQE